MAKTKIRKTQFCFVLVMMMIKEMKINFTEIRLLLFLMWHSVFGNKPLFDKIYEMKCAPIEDCLIKEFQ